MSTCSPTEHIEFSIFNNFLGLDELATISMVNKSYNLLAKREIKKIYKIIEKIRKVKIQVNNSSLYSMNSTLDCVYNQNYWYKLFGKKLNRQELAIYYAYFITKYSIGTSNWCCTTFNDGFIKQLGSKSDGSVSLLSYNEPEIYVRFSNYSRENISVNFEERHIPIHNDSYIDEKLLKKCVRYIIKNSGYEKNDNIIKRPSITDAIEYLYPILIKS